MIKVLERNKKSSLLKCTCGKVFTAVRGKYTLRCPSCSEITTFTDKDGKEKNIKRLSKKKQKELFNMFISVFDTFYGRTDGKK